MAHVVLSFPAHGGVHGLCALASALAALGAWRVLRRRHSVRTATLALGPLLLTAPGLLRWSGWAYEHAGLPFLVGTTLWPLLALATGVAAWRLWPAAPERRVIRRGALLCRRAFPGRRWWSPLPLAGLTLVALWAATPRWLQISTFGGDEPHYLLIAHSLLTDGDLDLANNYRNGDGARWTDLPMRPHVLRPGRRGESFSMHGVGLPLLLLPGFALGGSLAGPTGERVGALVIQQLWVALLVVSLARLTGRCAGGRRPAATAVAVLIGSLPWAIYSFTIYTEIPAGALTTLVVDRLLRPAPSLPMALGLAVAIWFLPFLHFKYLVLAVGLSALLLMRVLGASDRRGAGLLIGFLALASQALPLYHAWLYGSYGYLAAWGPAPAIDPPSVGFWMAGQWLDRRWGLAIYAPFAAVGLAELLRWARRRPLGRWLLLLAGGHLTAVSTTSYWTGTGPWPNRFLAPIVPLLAMTWARRTFSPPGPRRRPATVAAGLLSVLVGIASAADPSLVTQRVPGVSMLFTELAAGAHNLGDYLPSFETPAAELAPLLQPLTVLASVAAPPLTGADPRGPRDDVEAYLARARRGRFGLRVLWTEAEGSPPPPAPQIRMLPYNSWRHRVEGAEEADDRVSGGRARRLDAAGTCRFALREALPPGAYIAQLRLRNGGGDAPLTFTARPPNLTEPLAELPLRTRDLGVHYQWISVPFRLERPLSGIDLELATGEGRHVRVWVDLAALVAPLGSGP